MPAPPLPACSPALPCLQLDLQRSLSTHQLDGQAAVLAAQLQEAQQMADAAKALVLQERQKAAEMLEARDFAARVGAGAWDCDWAGLGCVGC